MDAAERPAWTVVAVAAESVDANWLPNTVAASSATLVAIVGGLLASRLVAQRQEHDAAAAYDRGLAARVAGAEEALAATEAELHDVQVRSWGAQALPIIADAPAHALDFAWLLRHVPSEGPPDLLKAEFDALSAKLREAVGTLDTASRELLLPADWKHGLGMCEAGSEDAWEERIYAEAYRRVYEVKAAADPDMPPLLGPGPPAVAALTGRRPVAELAAEQRRRIEALAAARQEKAAAAARVGATPRGFPADVLLLLLGSTAVGVVFPLTVLAFQPADLVWWLRALLVGAFVAAVGGVVESLRRQGIAPSAGPP